MQSTYFTFVGSGYVYAVCVLLYRNPSLFISSVERDEIFDT